MSAIVQGPRVRQPFITSSANGSDSPSSPRAVYAAATPPAAEPFFLIALLYTFLQVSRAIEFLPFLLPQLRLMLVLSVVLIGVVAVTGKLPVIWESMTGRLLIGFVIWMAFTVPFAAWRGNSFASLVDELKVLAFVLIFIPFAMPLDRWFKMCTAVMLGFAMTGVIGLMKAADNFGRGAAGHSEGTLGDSNYFAMYLLTGLPLIWVFGRNSSMLGKLFAVGASLLQFKGIASTGSRSAIVALAALMAFLFVHLPSRHKIKMVVVGCALTVGFILVAPGAIKTRIATLFSSETHASNDEEAFTVTEATSSSEARRYLLMQSLRLTALHPIFGVGPGNFSITENDLAKEQGLVKGAWHQTHNMYTQVSSEMGLPGLVIFCAAFFISFRNTSRIRRMNVPPGHPLLEKAKVYALYLQAAMIVVAVEGMFLSIAYAGLYWIVNAMAVALHLGVRQELTRVSTAAAPAPPPSRFVFSRNEALAGPRSH